MDETNAGVKLRVTRQAFFQPRHSDQDDADFSRIEDGPNLFEAGHSEAVRLINQNERRRVTDLQFLDRVFFCNLPVRRVTFWQRFGQPVDFVQKLGMMLFISPPKDFQTLFFFQPQGTYRQIPKRVATTPDIGTDIARRIDNGRRVKNCIESGNLAWARIPTV